jgi:hypothetical protein
VLPVPYFHVVFTLPQKVGGLALQNAKEIYRILFRAASETLLTIAADPQHLGAEIGFLAILHTWDRSSTCTRIIICVVPGGGIGPDGYRLIGCAEKSFFLPVKVLSKRFRNLFLTYLRAAFQAGSLKFTGEMAALAGPGAFEALYRAAKRVSWVVFAKPPFGGAEQVLKYLARYTHRVAISNHRLLSMSDGRVSFEYKDYAGGNQTKVMTLEAAEFIRRFLLHVVPHGFVRIRQFGFLANRARRKKLALCRALLNAPLQQITTEDGKERRSKLCPVCQTGRMILIQTIRLGRPALLPRRDSS